MYDLPGQMNVILITIWWLKKLGQAVRKQEAQKFDAGRFNLRKVSWRLGNSIRLRSPTGLQFWRT
jgi:hypothetical protein